MHRCSCPTELLISTDMSSFAKQQSELYLSEPAQLCSCRHTKTVLLRIRACCRRTDRQHAKPQPRNVRSSTSKRSKGYRAPYPPHEACHFAQPEP